MITVLRKGGFRVVIFSDDHEPAHVHVFGDGEAKIDIIGPHLVWAVGMKSSDVRKSVKLVEENQYELLERWAEIHG